MAPENESCDIKQIEEECLISPDIEREACLLRAKRARGCLSDAEE
jgi:hypothetical protein